MVSNSIFGRKSTTKDGSPNLFQRGNGSKPATCVTKSVMAVPCATVTRFLCGCLFTRDAIAFENRSLACTAVSFPNGASERQRELVAIQSLKSFKPKKLISLSSLHLCSYLVYAP